MKFFSFSDFGVFSESVLTEIFSDNPKFLALAGGSLEKLYPAISRQISPFVHIFPADERAVPLTDGHSNGGKIHRIFSESGVRISDFDFPDFVKITKEAEGIFFDVAVLGIGSDGHFASIFPENPDIFDSSKILQETKAPANFSIFHRASFCPQFFAKSRKIIFVLLGKEKGEIFSELQNPTKTMIHFPAHFFQNHPQTFVFWTSVTESHSSS